MINFFAIGIAVSALANLCAGSALCDGGQMTQSDSEQILKLVNDRRSTLVKGEQVNGLNGTNLTKGKNMKKMEWDCELEKEAIALANDQCSDVGVTGPADKALIYIADYDYGYTVGDILKQNLDYIDMHPLTDVADSVKYNDESVLKNYANLMRSTTSKVGCHLNKCTVYGDDRYALSCLTDQKPLAKGDVIYEKSDAAGCTCESADFYCDSNNFCVSSTTSTSTTTTTTATSTTTPQSLVTLPTGTNNQCTSNNGMTDNLRTAIVNMHNYRRGLLAQGKVARKNGNYYKTATNMAELTYDCGLETSALAYAKTCPSGKSGITTEGENIARIPTSGVSNWVEGMKQAVVSWWKVVRTSSIGVGITAVTFRQTHVNTVVETWSQMAWATTTKIGCSVVQCSNNYVTVCRYKEKGNIVEQKVYIPGVMCSACTKGCTENGLCKA